MSTLRQPCPRCNRGPRDTALSVTIDERGTVAHCFRCGYVEVNNATASGRAVPKSYRPWLESADHLWCSSEPLADSLAASYLQRRGCRLPPGDGDLRYLPARDDYPAAMLGRVTDILTAEPISLHFTKLNPDGTKHAEGKRLLAGHRKAGGVIRIWPDEAVTYGLALSEGIETALSAAHAFKPVWCAIDAGNLAALPLPAGIETLTIYADHDAAGIAAARTLAQRWADAGREVYITMPTAAGADINDLLVA